MMITRVRGLICMSCRRLSDGGRVVGSVSIRLVGCFCLLKYHLTRLNGVWCSGGKWSLCYGWFWCAFGGAVSDL